MIYDSQVCLAGKLLIAMPGLRDAHFARSVVFVCAHSSEGAMGLIINRPMPKTSLKTLLNALKIEAKFDLSHQEVMFGGPVQAERGFVLHTPEAVPDPDSLVINKSFAMTATLEMLTRIAQGAGPLRGMVMLGYAGWGPGQLDAEILANGWLTVTPGAGLVFSQRHGAKWAEALHLLGVAPQALSAMAGHA